MKLSGKQKEELQNAMLSAFPELHFLQEMVRLKLGKNLPELVSTKNNLRTIIFDLIEKATTDGWLEELVDKAHEYNRGNPELKQFVQSLKEENARPDIPCPYRGLSAFTEEHEHLFFGREKFVQQLVDAVKQQQNPLVPVIGASGSGKSSVVLAGLIPRLRAEGNWLIESFRPQSQPFYELASALVLACYPELKEEECKNDRKKRVTELFDQFERNRKLWQEVRDILKEHPGKRLLLVVDQFEELYALDNKQEFVNALLEAIKLNPRFKLVLTIRTDFLDYIINDPPFKDVALKPDTPQYLGAMNDEKDIKSVIELTDDRRTENIVKLEEGLTDTIWKDVKQEPGNLPLLEFALRLLWEKNGGGILTNQRYIKIGGVKKALANHADDIYKNLNDQEKKQFKQIFVQLARPGEFVQPASLREKVDVAEEEKRRGQQSFDEKVDIAEEEKRRGQQSFVTPDTRRLATRAEIGEGNWRLVQKLAGEDRDIPEKKLPLLVTGRNENTGEQTVEVVHEVLIREWPDLRKWIHDDRTFLTWRDLLRINIAQWKKGEASLLRDQPLVTAEDWLQKRPEDLTNEREYIQLSLDSQQREKEQQEDDELEKLKVQAKLETEQENSQILASANQRLTDANQEAEQKIRYGNVYLAVSIVVGVLFLGSAAIAIHKQIEAQKGTQLEQQSNSIIRQFPNNQIQGLLSAIQAGEELKEQVKDNRPLDRYPTLRPLSILREILDKIHEKNQFNTNQEIVKSLSFSPDSKYIATAGQDGTLRLWNLSGKEIIKPIKAHDGRINGVNSVSFSSDGKTIATSGEDGKIKIWDLFGNLKITLLEKEGGVKSVSFSPDNKKLATAGDYGIARIWDLSTKSSVQLEGYKVIKINSITFSPDGKKIATAGDDGTVRFSDLSGKPVGSIITPHNGKPVYRVSFSPNGQRLATAGEDNVARILNLSRQEQKKLEGHQGLVSFVSFSPDGKRLVTTSEDGTVRVWDFLSGQEIYRFKGHERKVLSASFSPDGQYLASAGKDVKTRIWNLSDRQKTQTTQFKGHQSDVNTLSISPDGTRMASGDNNGFVRLWDLSTNKQIGKEFKADNRGRVLSITFSPDRKFLISGGEEGIAKIWDLSGQLIRQLKEKQGNSFISSLSFSSDGKYIATTGANQTPKIWSWDGEKIAKKIATLEGHQGLVYQVSFHPKQELIATGAWDGTIGLWKLSDNKVNKIKIWSGHQGKIRSLSFSSDGKYLATADDNSELKVWDLSGQEKIKLFSYQREIQAVAFSSDGKYIATGGKDGTVKLWDWLGRQVFEFKIEKGSVWDISFSADGRSIVAGGDSGQLQSWPVKDLDQLLAEGCDWLKGYLENSGQTKDKLEVCRNKDSNPK